MNSELIMEQLRSFRLHGMALAFEQQVTQPHYRDSSFEERIMMMLKSEESSRDTSRYNRMMRNGKLRIKAMPEDFEFKPGRGLSKEKYNELATCNWITVSGNIMISGATGCGKTWLACSLAVAAARNGMTIYYDRSNRLLESLATARVDGSLGKLRIKLEKYAVLIIDDFGLNPLSAEGRMDLLDLLDDRLGKKSTIIVGQLPFDDWHEYIGDQAIADAILDRLVNTSDRIQLKGESMRSVTRKKKAKAK